MSDPNFFSGEQLFTVEARQKPKLGPKLLAMLVLVPLQIAGRGWVLWLAWRWWALDLGAAPLPYGHAVAAAAVLTAPLPKPDGPQDRTSMDVISAVLGWWLVVLPLLFVLGLVVR